MKNVIEQVANTIIERLEGFSEKAEMPFMSSFPKNVHTKKGYRGINVLILSFAALFNNYNS